MKAAKKPGIFRRTLRNVLNIRNWTDYDRHKGVFSFYFKQALRLPNVQRASYVETFEEALERLNLTELQLQEQASKAIKLSMLFFLLSFCLLIYTITLAWHKHFFGFLVGFLLTLTLLSRAFYFHFWHFQIKHRKLGCTITEWLNGKVKDEHES